MDLTLLMSEGRAAATLRGARYRARHQAAKGASVGAVVSGGLGAVLAGLAGAGTIAFPGIGLIAMSPVAVAFTGGAIGGAGGGLVGALIAAGFSRASPAVRDGDSRGKHRHGTEYFQNEWRNACDGDIYRALGAPGGLSRK
jgi:hypothetical protein